MLKDIRFSKSLLIFLPSIALLPVTIDLLKGLHSGGLNIAINFLSASVSPSIDYKVLESAIKGLETTLAIATIAWSISLIIGLILGIISSSSCNQLTDLPSFISITLKYLLSIPRSIHEVVWGLLLIQVYGLNIWISIIAISIPNSALMARIFADQFDSIDYKVHLGLKNIGAKPLENFITSVIPKLIPIVGTFGGHRLECAIRGATLLGIFGLGGIGTELQLSIRSLEFNEMWTSLWLLGMSMFLIEKLILFFQTPKFYQDNISRYSILGIFTIILSLILSINWLYSLELGIAQALVYFPIDLPSLQQIKLSIYNLNLITLILQTVHLTLLSAAIAISLPPIILIFCSGKVGRFITNFFWMLCRLFPVPLIALLLLLCTDPSISVAALALGINNMGSMGRILQENIRKHNKSILEAIIASGSTNIGARLYGQVLVQSKSYLAYSAYRTDVMLRETALVGVVGGVGLGWQLQESLSSFNWSEIIVITCTFASITLFGEITMFKLQQYLSSDEVQLHQ